jgi:hypothetical protein
MRQFTGDLGQIHHGIGHAQSDPEATLYYHSVTKRHARAGVAEME